MQFSPVIKALEYSLDASSLRQKVIAQNIANVDTPNYKSKNVVFSQELKNKLNAYKTSERHVDFSTGGNKTISIETNEDESFLHNGNNVDIDREMAEMAKNQLYYQALVDRLNGKFNSLELVIRGGR